MAEIMLKIPEAPPVYNLVVDLVDKVGNENRYYAQFILADDWFDSNDWVGDCKNANNCGQGENKTNWIQELMN